MQSFSAKLKSNDFLVTTELTPPKGTDLSIVYEKAEMLKCHVSAFNITESHAARMSCDPIAVGHHLAQRGIEPIVQMTSRDKNRIAIQSAILGASTLGIQNIVLMGGDPPKIGDHPDAKGVFDLYASQLVEAGCSIKSGTDMMGNALKGTPELCVGTVFNPGASDLGMEVENTKRKLDAGAEFFQTQAIYETQKLETFLNKLGNPDIPVLAGIIPIKSVKMATYMNQRVPGIDIPEHLMSRIADAEKQNNVSETSIEICHELIQELNGVTRGLHIMAIGWEDKIPDILRKL